MWVEPFEELEELSRKVLVLIAVVVDGAVTGNYRYTTLKDATDMAMQKLVPTSPCGYGNRRTSLAYGRIYSSFMAVKDCP